MNLKKKEPRTAAFVFIAVSKFGEFAFVVVSSLESLLNAARIHVALAFTVVFVAFSIVATALAVAVASAKCSFFSNSVFLCIIYSCLHNTTDQMAFLTMHLFKFNANTREFSCVIMCNVCFVPRSSFSF